MKDSTALDLSGSGFEGIDESEFSIIEGGGNEEYPIFRTPSKAIADDEFTLKAGQKITATFLGTKVMVSKEKKENWTKEVLKVGTKSESFYTNKHFVFQDANGNKFGLYRAGTLWNLEKLKTMALGQAKANPVVMVEYVDLVAKEDLAQYKVEIETGEAAHVFRLYTGKDAEFNTYAKGCVNLLGNPMPMHKEDNGLTGIQQDIENYNEATKLLAQRDSVGGATQAQLS